MGRWIVENREAEYKKAFYKMCEYFLSHMEGDDLYTDDAYALMRKHGLVDEDGFPNDKLFEEDE